MRACMVWVEKNCLWNNNEFYSHVFFNIILLKSVFWYVCICIYHSLIKRAPIPYFWHIFLYRVKVYSNEALHWSKLCVGNEAYL